MTRRQLPLLTRAESDAMRRYPAVRQLTADPDRLPGEYHRVGPDADTYTDPFPWGFDDRGHIPF